MEAVKNLNKMSPSEEIWEILNSVSRIQKESAERIQETDRRLEDLSRKMEETDRQMKENAEQQKETSAQMKETDRQMKETSAQMKETDRKIGKLGNRLGEMIEYMVKPNLLNKFRELGFVFTKIYQQVNIKDEKNQIVTEVDITLENGDKVMLVEVKSKPSIDDIKEHLERMEKVRRHGSLRGDTRKYLGAIAGMVLNGNEREFALKNGFYTVEPAGETFTISTPKEPREW